MHTQKVKAEQCRLCRGCVARLECEAGPDTVNCRNKICKTAATADLQELAGTDAHRCIWIPDQAQFILFLQIASECEAKMPIAALPGKQSQYGSN